MLNKKILAAAMSFCLMIPFCGVGYAAENEAIYSEKSQLAGPKTVAKRQTSGMYIGQATNSNEKKTGDEAQKPNAKMEFKTVFLGRGDRYYTAEELL